MPRLVKKMPRFARKAGREKYSVTEGAPSSLWAHLLSTRSSLGGVAVDPQSALSLTAYYAGVRVISEDVASLPVAVFKRKPGGDAGAVLVRDHPVSVLFSRCPDGSANETTSLQWREALIAHVLGWGNGYAEIERSNDGRDVMGLHLMHPDRTRSRRDANGALWYEDLLSTTATGEAKRLPAANVLHLAGLGFNGYIGYSPVALARQAIGLGRAAEEYGSSLFTNGAVPKGFLKHPGRLKPEAASNLRESWNAVHQGVANANKVGILEEGMDWVATSINPDDAQFLATRQFQVVEIARMLRLPPHKIGDYTQAHLANIEASNLDYLMTCLRPWCVRVEQAFGLKLLSDKEHRLGYYVRHDIRALLRASIKDRALYYQAMFQFGMSPNEIRELEDINPIPDERGGNKRFVTVNSVPLETAGEPEAVEPPGEDATPADEPADDGPSTYSHRLNGHFSHENGVIP
jgi:HK97 family phage portal protein